MDSTIPNAKDVTESFLRFKNFLNDSWPSVDKILMEHDWDDDPNLLDDWLENNWKYLFIRQVLGKTSEANSLQPLSISTIEIKKCRYRYQLQINNPPKAIFVALGTQDNGFSISPPFDQIQILKVNGKLDVVPLSSIIFSISKVKK